MYCVDGKSPRHTRKSRDVKGELISRVVRSVRNRISGAQEGTSFFFEKTRFSRFRRCCRKFKVDRLFRRYPLFVVDSMYFLR